MNMLRITEVEALDAYRLRMTLTNGEVVERDVSAYLHGPLFEAIRGDAELFRAVRVAGGTVVWPNGADLCPDVLIWGGMPPENAMQAAAR